MACGVAMACLAALVDQFESLGFVAAALFRLCSLLALVGLSECRLISRVWMLTRWPCLGDDSSTFTVSTRQLMWWRLVIWLMTHHLLRLIGVAAWWLDVFAAWSR